MYTCVCAGMFVTQTLCTIVQCVRVYAKTYPRLASLKHKTQFRSGSGGGGADAVSYLLSGTCFSKYTNVTFGNYVFTNPTDKMVDN